MTDSVAFCFGRFNPPHKGHVRLWETLSRASNSWFIGTNPNTNDNKNPLPYDIKIKCMESLCPKISGHIVKSRTLITLAELLNEHYSGKKLIYVTDSDDWEWSGELLNKYNGKNYSFSSIEHVESPRTDSSTFLKNSIKRNDESSFYKASGINPNVKIDGKSYFEICGEYMNMNEFIGGGTPQSTKPGLGFGNYVSQPHLPTNEVNKPIKKSKAKKEKSKIEFDNCVPISEDYQHQMNLLIEKLK